MLKKSYLVIGSIIFCLLFSSTVKAAVSYNTMGVNVTYGTTMLVRTETYTDFQGELVEAQDVTGTMQSWYEYNPVFHLTLQNTNQRWTCGYIIFNLTLSYDSMLKYSGYEFINNTETEGLHVTCMQTSDNTYRIFVMLDNFYDTGGNSELCQIKLKLVDVSTAYSATAATNISGSLSSVQSDVAKYDSVLNNRLTALMYSAITQATGQELNNITSMLSAINQQDYIYYNQLISQLTSLNQEQNTTNTNLLTLLERLGELREYIANRPTISVDIKKNRIKLVNGQYQFVNDNGQRAVLIPKSMLIKYVYINGFVTNNGNIFYFEDDPTTTSGAYVTPTRVIKLSAGEQYYPIDFQYNENYVYFNLGAAGYGDSIFKAYIGEGYEYQAILYYINILEEMNPEQSSEAAEQESAYAERDNQSQQLLNGMGSVQMPSISAGDLDILSQVDTTQKINFFGLIGLITHTEIVTKIMLIIVIGAIVGWVLYGKK